MMNSPNNQQTLLEELIKGRDFANQLEEMLHEKYLPGEMNMSTTTLVNKVEGSFSKVLALLEAMKTGNVEGRRTIQSTTRRRLQPYSRKKANTLDDGYAWRKYGQKAIYNAKFPRCYFRCTHKFSHSCKATRQTQQCEEDPPLFLISYFGEHTCNTTSCLDQDSGSNILDFASSSINASQVLKIESDIEEVFSANMISGVSSSNECMEVCELGTMEMQSEQSDVTSGFMQSFMGNSGLETMNNSLEFNDWFSFEHMHDQWLM